LTPESPSGFTGRACRRLRRCYANEGFRIIVESES
jgi:hypothetical protein